MRKKRFSYFSFQNFFGFWEKIFSDIRPKNFKKFSKLPSTCPEEQFVAGNFFKSFESFWIFCRNLWHGSQIFIYASRVKIAEETVFWFFFADFFRILREQFFRLSAKNLQKSCQNYLLRVQRNNLWLEIFLKVLNRFGFSAETFGMVLKFLSTCPE